MRPSDYLQSYRSLWGIGIVLAVTGPLALWVPDLQPPWPEGSQMIAAVFCVVVAILSVSIAHYFLGQPAASRSRSARTRPLMALWIGAAAIVIGLACGVYYLVVFNRYVVVDLQTVAGETRPIRIVIGTELRGDLENTRERPLQLLQEHGYDAEGVWTRDSILNARFLVFASFVAAFVFLTAGLAVLATITPRRSTGRTVKKL